MRSEHKSNRLTAPKFFAANLLMRFLSRKVLVDKRVFQKFKVWQDYYLNCVINYYVENKCKDILQNLKITMLRKLNFKLHLKLKRALHIWHRHSRFSIIQRITSHTLSGALKIASVLLRSDISNIDSFLLYFKNPSSVHKRHCLHIWKLATSEVLRKEHRQELSLSKLTLMLQKRTNTTFLAVFHRLRPKREAKLGIVVAYYSMRKLTVKRTFEAFNVIKYQRPAPKVKPWNSREKQAKLTLLQKLSSISRLSRLADKKQWTRPQLLKQMNCFIKWKKKVKPLERTSHLSMIAADSTVKNFASNFFLALYINKTANLIHIAFRNWKFYQTIQAPSFNIDKAIIANQAQVAERIEKQIEDRNLQIKLVWREIRLKNVASVFYCKLRGHFNLWNGFIKEAKSLKNDIFFEYLQFLEDKVR